MSPAATATTSQHSQPAPEPMRMEQRLFGPTPRQAAVIGQGTWYIDDADRPTAVATLRRGLDLGMTHIDTAEMYGEAEIVVGEAIVRRRDEVFLVSKVIPSNASRKGAVAACERSLARLRTDRLDCYLLHWPGTHPLEETFAGFERLLEQGKILSWGVSNFNISDLDAAWKAGGEGRIACNQVLYHLGERAIEQAVLPWCEEHGVAVVAYSPFGHGDFPDPRTSGGRVLADIAARHGATARQVALRFLVRRPSLFTIPKASSVAHAENNAGAGPLRLTEAERDRIEVAFPLGAPRHGLPILSTRHVFLHGAARSPMPIEAQIPGRNRALPLRHGGGAASRVVFVANSDASYITGANLTVDGGTNA